MPLLNCVVRWPVHGHNRAGSAATGSLVPMPYLGEHIAFQVGNATLGNGVAAISLPLRCQVR